VSQRNFAHPALGNKSKICLPTLHNMLGLIYIYIYIFVKAVNKESEGFFYLRQTFSMISEAKMKEGIFVDLQIKKKLFEDQTFYGKRA
jgi:hypothetical protein